MYECTFMYVYVSIYIHIYIGIYIYIYIRLNAYIIHTLYYSHLASNLLWSGLSFYISEIKNKQ